MTVIDIHTHAFPDGLAEKAMSALQASAGLAACGSGTVAALTDSMNASGIDRSVVCSIATRPGQFDRILAWSHQIRSDRIEPFLSVHPDEPDAPAAMQRVAAEGFAGVKMHPMYQEFHLDEPRVEPLLAAARDAGLTVVLHTGFDIAFRDDDRASPARVRRLIERWPGLELICAHFGGWQAWDQAVEHLLGADVYLDTSFTTQYLPAERVAELIDRHGADRIVFGTDWPWTDQAESIKGIRDLGLSDDVLTKILGQNAAELLGLA